MMFVHYAELIAEFDSHVPKHRCVRRQQKYCSCCIEAGVHIAQVYKQTISITVHWRSLPLVFTSLGSSPVLNWNCISLVISAEMQMWSNDGAKCTAEWHAIYKRGKICICIAYVQTFAYMLLFSGSLCSCMWYDGVHMHLVGLA